MSMWHPMFVEYERIAIKKLRDCKAVVGNIMDIIVSYSD